jgi:hypothetical protein
MNLTKLKNYAPKARREFIETMIDRAAFYGLAADKTEPIVEKGDVAVIGGRSFPIAVARKRKLLEARIKRQGFQKTMEAMAYTWFNRLVAIRFMELHGYLEHGYQVLSHPDGKPMPEILEHAEHVVFPGLKKDSVIDLKLAGNKEGELYRLLLTAQCNALHSAMPFLFERIDDETELLLPDNLLKSDSLIRKLVNEIDEADWQKVEIIGWMYQFYISEKNDEVIGKVVPSEDIPAATQLFTPNWIVKYLVQNTLGRQWLATYPQSASRQQMEYYIEPAEQTPEVQEQLKSITPTSLNPEELTLLDPACGSGHILVEAYDLFKAIYQERGYRAKDIPALILEKNLFGMEIDDRAAQLAAFALMMKARDDDRRIFESEAKPNILVFEDSQGMNANDIAYALNAPITKVDVPNEYLPEEIQEEKDGLFGKNALKEKLHVLPHDIADLLELFENAKTFGSLIQVPQKLAAKLTEIEKRLADVLKHGDLTHASAHVLKQIVLQAKLLARQYDAVVTNPPYLSHKGGMNSEVKAFAAKFYKKAKADVFSMFAMRMSELSSASCGAVAPYVWMYLSSFDGFREWLIHSQYLTSLIQLEYNSFEPACVPVCAWVWSSGERVDYRATYISLTQFPGCDVQAPRTLEAISRASCEWRFTAKSSSFGCIPGSPIAYTAGEAVRHCFATSDRLSQHGASCSGIQTGDNGLFLRLWHEVPFDHICFTAQSLEDAKESHRRWFPHKKGGPFRKWYGNADFIIDWENDGQRIKAHPSASPKNLGYMFKKGVTWSHTSSASFSARFTEPGFTFNVEGPTFIGCDPLVITAYLCSKPAFEFLQLINPTMHFLAGNVANLPYRPVQIQERADLFRAIAQEAVDISQQDWDSFETSWNFRRHPLLQDAHLSVTVESAFHKRQMTSISHIKRMCEIETKNNSLFIELFELTGCMSPACPESSITLERLSAKKESKSLISFAIGCIMGRYSLDKPGLIYANQGNQGFDPSHYTAFRADEDGIIPLLETDWGIRDDATNRFVEFIGVAWPKECLEENLKFVADSLGSNNGEQPRETIRRYLGTAFYKDHLQQYKGPKLPPRPIYWLFSSGKQCAFQCLVYLHRYNEGTLARMRTEYVIPLQGLIAGRIEQLEGDKTKATSTSHRNKIQKEQDKLKKHQVELATFEEKLKHYADMRIVLDLDDGVKVNYAKFGDLLAESKAITGGKDDE